MANPVNFTFEGGKELSDLLKELPDKVAKNVMVGATYAGATAIRDLARQKVPILDLEQWHIYIDAAGYAHGRRGGGGPHEPGDLLAHIQARRTRSRDRNTIGAKIGLTSGVWWGKFVEFGTRHARAFPFMRPAVDEGKEGAVQAMIEYAGKRIEAEAKKK